MDGNTILRHVVTRRRGENNCNGGDTFSSNYKFGDGKTGDSANCGPYKNNCKIWPADVSVICDPRC